MDIFKSQILNLLLIAALLAVTPFLSTSLRPTYLYFLFNLLVIVLGADAGLLSLLSEAVEDKKTFSVVAPKMPLVASAVNSSGKENVTSSSNNNLSLSPLECDQKKANAVAESHSEKIVGAVKVHAVKKCPSTPSIFFIGGMPENEDAGVPFIREDDYDEDQVEIPSGQELYHKAEMFIGNFYKQLKMQREESWKKIHGLCHKAF